VACLAPDIVETIVAGKQPRSLTLKRLLRGIPLSWAEQRERFGLRQAEFSARTETTSESAVQSH
jgi:hypothetical protein